jgi:predicted membrane-bound spermidine synthase
MKISPWKKAISFLTPVRLWKGSSPVNPVLELLLSSGRYQLATVDALYSDGNRYRPLVAGLGEMRRQLSGVKSVLVLGAGLGSAVDVLRTFGARPEITLVELDEVVARWGRELLRSEDRDSVRFVVEDAQVFVQEGSDEYDLVIVDVFSGREPLPFVTQPDFLRACKQRMAPGGMFLLNYMLNAGSAPWDETLSRIETVFAGARVLAIGPNRVMIYPGFME